MGTNAALVGNGMTWNARMNRASDSITKSFGSFIYRRPITVMVVTGFICGTLMALGINFGQFPDLSDPTKGFETRNTKLSARVVTWTKLNKALSIYPDPTRLYFRKLQNFTVTEERYEEIIQRRKRRASRGISKNMSTGSLCLQMVEDIPDGNYYSQIIFQADGFDSLFSLTSQMKLCKFQQIINSSFDPIRSAIDYLDFWSLPNYMTCLHNLSSCSELTEPIIKETADIVKSCYKYMDIIIACNTLSTSADATQFHSSPSNCSTIPQQCQSKLIYHLFYFILSTNICQNGASPVYTNLILPILQWEAYRYLGTPGVTVNKMLNIYGRVFEASKRVEGLEMKGIQMGVKLDQWLHSFYGDWDIVFGAVILVYLLIWLYSGSLFFTISVLCSVVFSMGVAYFVYRLVFRIRFFPFMNLLMVILLVGIGADDTFVLKHIFDTSRRRIRSGSVTLTNFAQVGQISFSKEEMRDALSHAALSMFICSATTSAAFYANLVSEIVVIKCFGVFAGTTMLVNYLLVVTWLPASLIVMDAYLNPFCDRVIPRPILRAIRKLWTMGALLPHFLLLTALPRLVMVLKYFWITLFGLIFTGACVVVFYWPGMAVPTNNQLQMFKASNPMEWYDDNTPYNFKFSKEKDEQPVDIAVVFGIEPIDDNSVLDPNDYENGGKMEFQRQPGFLMNISFLNEMNQICQYLNNSTLISDTGIDCFPDRFRRWSVEQSCSNRRNTSYEPCCNLNEHSFNETRDLTLCLAESTKSIDVMNGGPIFRVNDLKGVDGFVLFHYINRTWSNWKNYNGLRKFFTTVDNEVNEALLKSNLNVIRNGWMVTTYYHTMVWYDLQISLELSTLFRILVSVGIALIVAVVTMRAFVLSILSVLTVFAINVVIIACLILLGWHLNIVESTLIVLTVGLAFDFTLNYAVAYQLSPKETREQKVCTVLQYMGMPVLLAYLTTFLAGLIMLPSSIMAYYQIGLFMVIVGSISWLYSALFFLSLLAVFGPEDCEWAIMKKVIPSVVKRVFTRSSVNTAHSTAPIDNSSTNYCN